jgi:hypothetical protein
VYLPSIVFRYPLITRTVYHEPNNFLSQAYELDFKKEYSAYPDDLDDWYSVFLTQTSSLHVQVDDYFAHGQLVVYSLYCYVAPFELICDDRQPLANDTRKQSVRSLPNEVQPQALTHLPDQPEGSGLPPGRYYIRVYSSGDLRDDKLYRLETSYDPTR